MTVFDSRVFGKGKTTRTSSVLQRWLMKPKSLWNASRGPHILFNNSGVASVGLMFRRGTNATVNRRNFAFRLYLLDNYRPLTRTRLFWKYGYVRKPWHTLTSRRRRWSFLPAHVKTLPTSVTTVCVVHFWST